jgi:hypothetical protein
MMRLARTGRGASGVWSRVVGWAGGLAGGRAALVILLSGSVIRRHRRAPGACLQEARESLVLVTRSSALARGRTEHTYAQVTACAPSRALIATARATVCCSCMRAAAAVRMPRQLPGAPVCAATAAASFAAVAAAAGAAAAVPVPPTTPALGCCSAAFAALLAACFWRLRSLLQRSLLVCTCTRQTATHTHTHTLVVSAP